MASHWVDILRHCCRQDTSLMDSLNLQGACFPEGLTVWFRLLGSHEDFLTHKDLLRSLSYFPHVYQQT